MARNICPPSPRVYQTKVKNAQEAHEAIRPGRPSVRFARALRGRAQPRRVQALRLDLEADRGQPDDRRPRHTGVTITRAKPTGRDLSGQRQDDRFPRLSAGLCRRLRRSASRPGRPRGRAAGGRSATNARLPRAWSPRATPRSRPIGISEATLTRALEEMGIGRPSTYASIIDTILAREYVFKSSAATCWCPPGRPSPCRNCLEIHLPTWSTTNSPPRWKTISTPSAAAKASIPNTCTASISATAGRQSHAAARLKPQLENKVEQIDARDVSRITIGQPEGQEPIFVRVGRYGPFLEQGERRASMPDTMAARRTDASPVAWNCSSRAQQAEEPLGMCPETGQADLSEDRPLRALRAAGRRERRRKAAKRLAAQGDAAGGRRRGDGREAVVAAAHLGEHPTDGRTGGGPQRPLRALREMRRAKRDRCRPAFRRWT